jgi:D-alanine-D-alanine ligase
MKICVLQPDYGRSEVDYRNYDQERDLSELYPEAHIEHAFLNKLSTYRQLKELKKQGFDIFVNLCEAYLEWDIPSIDVVHSLEMLDLPYTGPTPFLYDPPKPLMKYVSYTAGVQVPNFAVIEHHDEIDRKCSHLSWPMFVKPAKAGDSLGIGPDSLVHNTAELKAKVQSTLDEFDTALVEEYIDGREFTVLLVGNPNPMQPPIALRPLEFIFPKGEHFKTYDLKITQWHPECNVPCLDEELSAKLKEASIKVFKAFEGKGYARCDFRLDKNNELFFLEINFACSIFYHEGYEGSADYILKYDGIGQAGFLRLIIDEGIGRWKLKRRNYEVHGNAIEGFGIYAIRHISAGEIIFRGEEKLQRITTKSWVENNWTNDLKASFKHYAYPLSDEVYLLWDSNPEEWAPQNHSCDPNTAYRGLNVVALRDIQKDEELTLDYADFCNESAAGFECHCGSTNCRSYVQGTPGNSVTLRETERRKDFPH